MFFRYSFPFKIPGYIFEILFVLTILIYLSFKRVIKKFFLDNSYLIVQVAIIAFCFMLVYPVLARGPINIRHTTVLFTATFLLFLRSLDYIQKKYFKGFLISAIFIFYSISSFNSYKSFVKYYDIHESIDYLSGKSKENEPIVLVLHYLAEPFIYYFEGSNEINILPPVALDYLTKWDATDLAKPAGKEFIEKLFSRISKNNSFWIINLNTPAYKLPDLVTIDSLVHNTYKIETDTLISDPKRYKTYLTIQMRKVKHN